MSAACAGGPLIASFQPDPPCKFPTLSLGTATQLSDQVVLKAFQRGIASAYKCRNSNNCKGCEASWNARTVNGRCSLNTAQKCGIALRGRQTSDGRRSSDSRGLRVSNSSTRLLDDSMDDDGFTSRRLNLPFMHFSVYPSTHAYTPVVAYRSILRAIQGGSLATARMRFLRGFNCPFRKRRQASDS